MKKLGLLPFVLLALLVSCSEDSVKEVPATGPESRAPLGEAMNARMGATTGDQIPDIVGELERLTGKRAGNASKGMNLEDVAIDFSDIRWIIGQNTGRTNYTFPVLVKGQGMEAFYNLIVIVEPDGEILPPIMREYRVAPNAMEGFRASGYDLAGFSGTKKDYLFEDFFNASFDLDLLASRAPGCPPTPIGPISDNPEQNPDLIVVDQHQYWTGGGNIHPIGQVSYEADAYGGMVHNALVYVNITDDGNNHTQYQETVTTYSEGVVNVGTPSINAPVLGNFFVGPPTVTGVTVTVSGVGSEENGNYCVTRVEETTHYSNGYTQTRTIYTDVCTDSPGPDMKGSMAGRSSQDCPDGGDGSIVLVPYELVVIQDKLCLPVEGQAYGFLMDNGAERHQLYTFLMDNNVPDGCSGNSPARLFALQAAVAMPQGEVDFEDRIIISNSVPSCVINIITKIRMNDTYVDLGDMPDFVKQELNLSGFIMDVFNNSDNYHLNFEVADLPLTNQGEIRNASTNIRRDQSTGYVYFDIALNTSYVSNATDLAISRTIIHESLHAYISYTYQTEMFSDLSNSLRHLLSQDGASSNSAQHALMTSDFVEGIANALESWDESSLVDNNYYKYLSWSGGMLATKAFDEKSEDFQQNCINANIAEGNAGPNGNYNPSSAKGEKNCN